MRLRFRPSNLWAIQAKRKVDSMTTTQWDRPRRYPSLEDWEVALRLNTFILGCRTSTLLSSAVFRLWWQALLENWLALQSIQTVRAFRVKRDASRRSNAIARDAYCDSVKEFRLEHGLHETGYWLLTRNQLRTDMQDMTGMPTIFPTLSWREPIDAVSNFRYWINGCVLAHT